MMQHDRLENIPTPGQKLHHFHGGLRLRHHKKISCQEPLQRLLLPPRLFIPLVQHAGGEALPLVTTGQKVLKGEQIARFENPDIGYVHASTSGTVVAITRQAITHPVEIEGLCVELIPDGLDQWMKMPVMENWSALDPAMLRERIRQSGVVGLGGAVFPTSKKLDEASRTAVQTLILNGAECEPYISCDEMLMREQPDKIVLGAMIMHKATGARQTIIAIEDQMGEVFMALQSAIDRCACDSVRLIKVTTIYPEGGEKQLIKVLTGMEVPAGGKPTDIGLLCQNVATAAAVAEAVIDGKTLVERIVTVSGNGIVKPRNVIALIGTPITHLIEHCGGYTNEAARLVLGGPMMGYSLSSDYNPVIKAANCVLVLNQQDIESKQQEMPCIRCGECARVCPALLLPQTLQWQIRNELHDDASAYGLNECIECGCCDFVCPSHIPLVEWFRFGKSVQRNLANEQIRANQARERFESRADRLETQKTHRRQRLLEKKNALHNDAQKKRNIAAAVSRAQTRHIEKPGSTEQTGKNTGGSVEGDS